MRPATVYEEVECERCGESFSPERFELLCGECQRADGGRTWPDRVADRIIHGIGHLTMAALLVWLMLTLLQACHVVS